MIRRPNTVHFQGKQTGMALIAALFMIIVVATFGVFAVRIGINQQQTANLELLGDRAFAAAYSGLEYGADRAFNLNCPPGVTVVPYGGFQLEVTCTPTAHASGVVYDLTATARSIVPYGSPDFVQRHLERRVTSIPGPTSPLGYWSGS